MGNYWAIFEEIEGDVFRFDTRIYLKPIESPETNDECIGAIIGKNPGSAKASRISSELQPINLERDQFLKAVRSIVTKAYCLASITPPERGYIQILNLFYLCNASLPSAIVSINKNPYVRACKAESIEFPWGWYAWGPDSKKLNEFKQRYSGLNATHHFFYDYESKIVRDTPASVTDKAKHTQGMPQIPVVEHLVKLLERTIGGSITQK
jgi:hypothetical protein